MKIMEPPPMGINRPAHAVRLPLIKRFDEIGIEDIPLVGGKNASLGEMRRALTSKGVPVPDGFATTASAYWHFLETSGLASLIDETLSGLCLLYTSDAADEE